MEIECDGCGEEAQVFFCEKCRLHYSKNCFNFDSRMCNDCTDDWANYDYEDDE